MYGIKGLKFELFNVNEGVSHRVLAYVLNYNIVVSESEPKSLYCDHFYPSNYGLNSVIVVIL